MATVIFAGLLVVAGSLISVLAYETPRRAVAEAQQSAPSTTPRTPSHTASPKPTSGRPRPHPPPPRTPRPTPTKPASSAVSAFGDSVMLGASPELAGAIAHLTVSAVEGRQARDVFADIANRRQSGTLAPSVVIHTGDNGIISPDDLSSTLRSLGNRRRVVLLTDRVTRDWQGPNNDILRSMVGRFHNVVLVDWYAVSNRHKDWFYNDGLHLRPPGARAYAAAVAAALRG